GGGLVGEPRRQADHRCARRAQRIAEGSSSSERSRTRGRCVPRQRRCETHCRLGRVELTAVSRSRSPRAECSRAAVLLPYLPCVPLRIDLEQTATRGHFGQSLFLFSIAGCNGGVVCSSTAKSRTAFFGPSLADCPVMSCFPTERLGAPVTE